MDNHAHKAVWRLAQTVQSGNAGLVADSRAWLVKYHDKHALDEAAYQQAVAVWEAQNGCTLF